jgi:HEAT repeat protein
MKRKMILLIGVVVVLAGVGWVFLDPSRTTLGRLKGETFYLDRPSSYWANAITSSDPSTLAEGLKEIGDGKAEAIPVLTDLYHRWNGSDGTSTAIRLQAITLIGKIGFEAKPALEVVIRAMQDSDAHVRTVALKAFIPIRETPLDAIPILIKLLESDQRLDATRAIRLYGSQAAEALPILKKLLNDSDSDVRWEAIGTIGRMGPVAKEYVPDLIALCNDEISRIREHTAEALGEIGPEAKEAIPTLIRLLTDKDTKVRRDSARSLGQIGEAAKVAVPHLMPLVNDPMPLVQEAARKAIRILDPSIKLEPKKEGTTSPK